MDPTIEMVDLGLSVKWAKYNIGATGGSTPESWYGNYYAWGEIETKSDYSWSTYAHCTQDYDPYEGDGSLTKYTRSDHKTILETADDIAAQVYGSNYRIPTEAEIRELNALPNQWVTNYNGISGLNGRIFTGVNDNTLFIPGAGYFSGSSIDQVGAGYIWSSALNSDYRSAWILYFHSVSSSINDTNRYVGCSIRAVKNA